MWFRPCTGFLVLGALILPAPYWGLDTPYPSVSSGLPCALPSPFSLSAPFSLLTFSSLSPSLTSLTSQAYVMTPLGPVPGAVALFVLFVHTLHTAVPACWLICFSNCPGGWESFTSSESPQKAGTQAASWLLLELMDSAGGHLEGPTGFLRAAVENSLVLFKRLD